MNHWTTRLIKANACEEAVEWAKKYSTAQEAWQACDRGDWMIWLCRLFNPKKNNKRPFVQTALAIAESVAHLTKSPEAKAARKAAQDWLNNPCAKTKQDARDAAAAAYDDDDDAAAADASYAAYAYDASYAYAAAAAYAAYDAAAYARKKQNKIVAEIIRQYLICPI
jgi:hypothetical protein